MFSFFRMIDDDDLFQKFWLNVRTRSGSAGPCYGDCKKQQLCQLLTSSMEAWRDCVAESKADVTSYDSSASISKSISPTILAVFVMVLWFF